MTYVLIACSALAAMLHMFIFYLETIAWTSVLARKTFGLSEKEAVDTKNMAANQGVYNLLLAIIVIVGLIAYLINQEFVGLSLVVAGCGAMALAALYLFFSSDKKQAAIRQFIFPAGAVISAIILLV